MKEPSPEPGESGASIENSGLFDRSKTPPSWSGLVDLDRFHQLPHASTISRFIWATASRSPTNTARLTIA